MDIIEGWVIPEHAHVEEHNGRKWVYWIASQESPREQDIQNEPRFWLTEKEMEAEILTPQKNSVNWLKERVKTLEARLLALEGSIE